MAELRTSMAALWFVPLTTPKDTYASPHHGTQAKQRRKHDVCRSHRHQHAREAGSVSNETQPSIPEVSTKPPKRCSLSLGSVAMPISVKPANNRGHHPPSRLESPKAPSKPTASMTPHMVPRQPSRKPVGAITFVSPPSSSKSVGITVVGDAVNRKIENHCYPIIRGGAPGSYGPGWAFKSLLGAMWLQMTFLMHEDRRCWWCGKPLDPGMPRHARFCKNNGLCRSNWNYNKGSGKSSKHARRKERYIG
jgi:hypothetical protein